MRGAERLLDCTYTTAGKAVVELEEAGLIREVTGNRRNRRFQFEPYLKLFQAVASNPSLDTPEQATRTP